MSILDFSKVTLVTHIGTFVPHLRWIILLDLDVLRIGPRCVIFADWT